MVVSSFWTPAVLIQEDGGAFDDLLWFATAYARWSDVYARWGYVQEQQMFAERTRTIFDYVFERSWDESTCGGGFWWSSRRQYKNAITNELAISTAFWLADAYPSDAYLPKATKALNWF